MVSFVYSARLARQSHMKIVKFNPIAMISPIEETQVEKVRDSKYKVLSLIKMVVDEFITYEALVEELIGVKTRCEDCRAALQHQENEEARATDN